MMGHRGCRLAVTYPEIAEMQTRAVIKAALAVRDRHPDWNVVPEIMIPLVGEVKELKYVKDVVVKAADEIIAAAGSDMKYQVGTMIEIPRAALTADQIAKEAEFFSFGTNDLTQMTFGFSRDDAGKFLGYYYDKKIYESDPFARVDQVGVGKLVKMAAELGRATRPDIHLGVCGEHGGDPSSVEFFHKVGLDYVSCSPFRVPIARLAAAQAAIKEEQAAEKEDKGFSLKADLEIEVAEEIEAKLAAAKEALQDATTRLQAVAGDATDDLKAVVAAGLKSLKAGWEEAKKTFGEERSDK
jgi:pyruvate,orthophosphate dikinase